MKFLLIVLLPSLLSVSVAMYAWVADVLRRLEALGSEIFLCPFLLLSIIWLLMFEEVGGCGLWNSCLPRLSSPSLQSIVVAKLLGLLMFQGCWRQRAVEFLLSKIVL